MTYKRNRFYWGKYSVRGIEQEIRMRFLVSVIMDFSIKYIYILCVCFFFIDLALRAVQFCSLTTFTTQEMSKRKTNFCETFS